MSASRFTITTAAPADGSSHGRVARLELTHGVVETPQFMPVGTAGTVKAVTPAELRAVGTTILLRNTYHLYLRPGHATVRDLGGLHRFMNWDGPILTDSGGFQVFSLEGLRTIDDDGVRFRSHLDGSTHRLTPELSMEIQAALGADIAMAFDECPPLPSPREAIAAAVERTTRWARRCREAWRGDGALFVSGVTAGVESSLPADHWQRWLSRPIDFIASMQAVRDLYPDQDFEVIEVGFHPVL